MAKRRKRNRVVGIDGGGNKIFAVVASSDGTSNTTFFEVDTKAGLGPAVAVGQMVLAGEQALAQEMLTWDDVCAVGFGFPGPADNDGRIGAEGSPNLRHPQWAGFQLRDALQTRLGLPTMYGNDGDLAALHAFWALFGGDLSTVLVSAAIGTGVGGGAVYKGHLVAGYEGYASEFGHVLIPNDDLLEPDQPMPMCGCGQAGDVEAWGSLAAIERNLLPWYLRQDARHPLHQIEDLAARAKQVRTLAQQGDPLCRRIFEVQARAIALLFLQLSKIYAPNVYVIGGGISETDADFYEWYSGCVRDFMWPRLPKRQRDFARLERMPQNDKAGALGAARLALIDLSAYPFVLEPMYFKMGFTLSPSMFLREGVADRLYAAQQTLNGLRFKIWDAWRPRAVQQALFDDYHRKLKIDHPEWDELTLRREIEVFVAPPDREGVVPPHATGGAVDLTLVDQTGSELDMGTGFDHFGPEAYPLYFEEFPVNQTARENRRLLRHVMVDAGFRPNPTEWWDFNFGNAVWAVTYGRTVAWYGEVLSDPQ